MTTFPSPLEPSFVRPWLALFIVALAAEPLVASNGWYLLRPILVENPVTEQQMLLKFVHWREYDKDTQRDLMALASLDRNASLGRWEHIRSFDTADACEQFRQKQIESAVTTADAEKGKFPDGLPTLGTHLAEESRCIASDDPRLAGR